MIFLLLLYRSIRILLPTVFQGILLEGTDAALAVLTDFERRTHTYTAITLRKLNLERRMLQSEKYYLIGFVFPLLKLSTVLTS